MIECGSLADAHLLIADYESWSRVDQKWALRFAEGTSEYKSLAAEDDFDKAAAPELAAVGDCVD